MPENTSNSELASLFEANYNDGDKIQGGQMIATTAIKDFIEQFVAPFIASKVREAERSMELYYLEKLNKVYDDINTGVAKKQSNSTYYINKAIHTEEAIEALQSNKEDV